ncbi:hypothetical protein PMZ80_009278 [Knufia obscura]|nr:hypothetical protein PMZ80_009278 [Knufia obscura]
MSRELDLYKRGGKSRLAETVHPGDSASQVSSNLLHDPDEAEDGLSAKDRMLQVKAKSEAGKGSTVSSRSKAMVPHGKAGEKSSTVSKQSSKSDAKSMLKIEDVSSNVSKSNVSSNSKAMVPLHNKALDKVAGSTVSKASSSASKASSSASKASRRAPDVDDASVASSSRSSSASKALVKPGSSVSKASSTASKASSSVSKASSSASKRPESVFAIEDVSSEVSKANSTRSSSSLASKDNYAKSTVSSSSKTKGKDNASSVSKASSTKSSRVSSASKSSGRSGKSRALVPAGKGERKVSPLQNEIRLEDLDDTYSLSIHERGPIANMPGRNALLAQIMQNQPHMEIDEASAIVDNQIATSSQIGRATAGSRVSALPSEVGSSSDSKSRASKAPSKLLLPPPSTVSTRSAAKSSMSKASSSASRTKLPPASDFEAELQSSLSKASTAKGKAPASTISGDVESYVSNVSSSSKKALVPSIPELAATPIPSIASVLSSPSTSSTIPDTGISPLLASTTSSLFRTEPPNTTTPTDLLALSQLRQNRELQRAQALASFNASRSTLTTTTNTSRLAELELAKQSLEDSRTLSRLQELGIHDDKLATLSRHAHEDQLSALARAETAEVDRRNSKFTSALAERESQEKARLRERRGDIAKEERRRQDERDVETQKEYERLDHDQKMEKIDAFGRWVDAATPRNVPQPRRSGLSLGYGYGYHNPVTGGDGTVSMRIGKGCTGTGGGGGEWGLSEVWVGSWGASV